MRICSKNNTNIRSAISTAPNSTGPKIGPVKPQIVKVQNYCWNSAKSMQSDSTLEENHQCQQNTLIFVYFYFYERNDAETKLFVPTYNVYGKNTMEMKHCFVLSSLLYCLFLVRMRIQKHMLQFLGKLYFIKEKEFYLFFSFMEIYFGFWQYQYMPFTHKMFISQTLFFDNFSVCFLNDFFILFITHLFAHMCSM